MDTQELLVRVKRNLMITWEDSDTEIMLKEMILSSQRYFKDKAGIELKFEKEAAETELLCERVRYAYNNALDDFEKNYGSEIAALILDSALSANEREKSDGDG